MDYLKKRHREEFDTNEQYYRYKIKSIEDKQEEIIDQINKYEENE